MKVINGVRYFTKQEVAELVGKSPQTINLWDKWSREQVENGKERFIPEPIRGAGGYRLWTEEQITQIKAFVPTVQFGTFSGMSNKQWGKRGVKKD